jgi:hypothetical protein
LWNRSCHMYNISSIKENRWSQSLSKYQIVYTAILRHSSETIETFNQNLIAKDIFCHLFPTDRILIKGWKIGNGKIEVSFVIKSEWKIWVHLPFWRSCCSIINFLCCNLLTSVCLFVPLLFGNCIARSSSIYGFSSPQIFKPLCVSSIQTLWQKRLQFCHYQFSTPW